MSTAPRTYLFVPGDRPERFDKACASGADAVIVDLEDAVAPDAKPRARQAVARWLSPERAVWLRINAAGSPWFADDLALLQRPGVTGAVLPKAESAEDLDALGVPSIALIESARGIASVHAIAGATGVQRLAFGSIDFQADAGIPGERDALLLFRSSLVLASRLAGLAAPIDGVTPALDDAERLSADVRYARELGFGAKLCIHPKQVAVVHDAFAPSAAEVAWAERVLAAVGAAGTDSGAIAVDGRMVDRPVLLRAQAILARR
jgi:citrate lyase subunit beta/citryl-CoA lyase